MVLIDCPSITDLDKRLPCIELTCSHIQREPHEMITAYTKKYCLVDPATRIQTKFLTTPWCLAHSSGYVDLI